MGVRTRLGLAIALLAATALAACTLDFDHFNPPVPSHGGTGSSTGGPPPDASSGGMDAGSGCTIVPAMCINQEQSCAAQCVSDQMNCASNCGGGSCRQRCNMTEQTCLSQCQGTCTSCSMAAGCAGAACPDAGP
jgi:hypothetical protein